MLTHGSGLEDPFWCVTATGATAGNTPVVLNYCEDDKLEFWSVSAGTDTGEIISTVTSDGYFCLTATGNGQGDPVCLFVSFMDSSSADAARAG